MEEECMKRTDGCRDRLRSGSRRRGAGCAGSPGSGAGPARMIAGGSGLGRFWSACSGVWICRSGVWHAPWCDLDGDDRAGERVYSADDIERRAVWHGRAAGKRVKRIREYARIWGDRGFVMLDDLKKGTG